MMEAARTSETLVNFYQTYRCYNPEDSNLHTHRRENLKSYLEEYSPHFQGSENFGSHIIPKCYVILCYNMLVLLYVFLHMSFLLF
jgi:hypothetical protein